MKAVINGAKSKRQRAPATTVRRDVQMYDKLEAAEAEAADLRWEVDVLRGKLDASMANIKALVANETSLKGNYNWLKERFDEANSEKARLEIAVSDHLHRECRALELEGELSLKERLLGKANQDVIEAERRLEQLRAMCCCMIENFYRIRARMQLLQRGLRGWVLRLCRVDLSEIEALAMERRLPE